MFKFSYANAIELMAALNKLKKNYRVTNNMIAEAAGVSATTVSKWLNYKTKGCSKTNKEKLEIFLAQVWQPALICITKFDNNCNNVFLDVGDVHDPFYSWIRPTSSHDFTPQDEAYISSCEKAVKEGRAKIYVVKYYKDMDEAFDVGREDVWRYTIGETHGTDTDVIFTGDKNVTKKALVFVPPKKEGEANENIES